MNKIVILALALIGCALLLKSPAVLHSSKSFDAGERNVREKIVDDASSRSASVRVAQARKITRRPIVNEEVRARMAAQLTADILAQLRSGDSTNRDRVFAELLPAFVIHDSFAAARLAESLKNDEGREEVMRRVAQLWATFNKDEAVAWASALPSADERENVLGAICLQIAESNPGEAVDIAERFVESKGPLLANLFQQWAQVEITAASSWLSAQKQGEQHEQLVARMAFVLAQNAPADAARLVVDKMAPGTTQNEAAISVLHQWAKNDPAGASAWVRLFPESPLRERALNELRGTDRPPDGPNRDSSL